MAQAVYRYGCERRGKAGKKKRRTVFLQQSVYYARTHGKSQIQKGKKELARSMRLLGD
jgi:hypothetical protein